MADPEVKNYNGNEVQTEGSRKLDPREIVKINKATPVGGMIYDPRLDPEAIIKPLNAPANKQASHQVPYFKTESKPQPSFYKDVQDLGQKDYGILPATTKALGMAMDRNISPVLDSIGGGMRRLGKSAFGTPNDALQPGDAIGSGGATVGSKDQFQPIDFNTPSIRGGTAIDKPKPKASADNIAFSKLVSPNNIGMSQGAKGNVRYAQGPDGQVMREDINSGNVSTLQDRTTHNVLKPGEKPFVMTRENTGAPGGSAGIGFDQIIKAIDRGDISAAEGQAVYQNANMSPAQRQQKALMQTAFTQPDGQTPIGSIGGMKRNAATAADLLSKQMAVDSNAAEYGARRESALAKMVQDQMQFDRNQKNADKALQLKQTGVNLDKAKRKQEMFAGRNEDSMYLDFLKREGGDNPTPEVIGLADRAYQDYLDQTLSQM